MPRLRYWLAWKVLEREHRRRVADYGEMKRRRECDNRPLSQLEVLQNEPRLIAFDDFVHAAELRSARRMMGA
jgi:hypothetical protein